MEYRRYLVCGGMPEAVISLLENRGMEVVEQVQQEILDLYELDFAKYATARDIPRIHAIWHSLPSQLAKKIENSSIRLLNLGHGLKIMKTHYSGWRMQV